MRRKSLIPFHRVRRVDPGSPPGEVRTDPQAVPSSAQLIAYSPDTLVEETLETPDLIERFLHESPVTWVNVHGLGTVELVQDLGRRFELHALAMEDVFHVGQRAKVEEYDRELFVIVRMPTATDRPESEQLSLFLGTDFLVTFQERPRDFFEPVRRRLRQGRARIRGAGPDYLAYALLDAVIDAYFPILTTYEKRITDLEHRLLNEDPSVSVHDLYELRRELLVLRGLVRPLREVVATLVRLDSDLIAEATRMFLRDCLDHAMQLVEYLDHHHEACIGLIELYQSSAGNRLNETMKVLTIIATIFIPITFIAGIYGMNFDPDVSPLNMPELRWFWGYPSALALMGIVSALMLLFFRRKGWIGSSGGRGPSSKEPSR
jgi:magnesium transporter